MAAPKEHYDVIVVGAGIQGLCAAHTFLTIDPNLSLLVIDNKSSVGGTWAKEQIYPGLRANNLQGFFEFTDFPILDAGVGVKPQGIVSGEAIAAYLQKYAEHFDILRHVRFNTSVLRATNEDDEEKAWTLELADAGEQAAEPEKTVTCSKLLVATGQTSRPYYPSYPGMDTFSKPIIHTADLASAGTALLEDPSVEHITVLGGGKSAHDTVYRFASAGKQVTWIIRETGRGGLWMAKSFPKLGPLSVWLEGLLMTRPLSWFGACPWSAGDGFGLMRYLLHNTTPGRWLTKNYFANMSQSTLDQSGILLHPSTRALIPKETLQWYGGQAGILNYPTDFYALASSSRVTIHRASLSHLTPSSLVLTNNTPLPTDALILATGYQFGPSFPVLPAATNPTWGIPHPPSAESTALFAPLDARADAELFARFPYLATSPATPEREPGLSAWRLWRFVAPPGQAANGPRNLAFLTNVETYQNVLKAELVALWAFAYLAGELRVEVGGEEEVLFEAVMWSRFGRWRCPMGAQGKTGDTLHDCLPYYDLLLRDLGVRSWRKGWGVLGEVFGGWYEVGDYRGVVKEWMAARGEREGEAKKVV